MTDFGSLGQGTTAAPEAQADLLAKLAPVLPEGRIRPYLLATGFDRDRALALYVWNAELGSAFHLAIQAVEVALRNRIDTAFTARFGSRWWREEAFRRVADREALRDLGLVLDRIAGKGLEPEPGQVVAGLSFGFWVGLLQPRYNPTVWSGEFRAAFPSFPAGRSRADLTGLAAKAVRLRNRIDHHEPIFRQDISKVHADLMLLLGWICPHKLEWIEALSRVPEMLRRRP